MYRDLAEVEPGKDNGTSEGDKHPDGWRVDDRVSECLSRIAEVVNEEDGLGPDESSSGPPSKLLIRKLVTPLKQVEARFRVLTRCERSKLS